MNELLRLITLTDTNTRIVLLGTTVLGIAAGVVGALALLRKRSLVGDAVAHAALPGICLAFLIVGDRNFVAFMIGATVTGVLAAAFVSMVRRFTRVQEDAAIAIAIGGFFGVGIVLSSIIQKRPGGNSAGLDGFIFGKAASMVTSDAVTILCVAAGVLSVCALLIKEFRLLCFDREFAAGQGWPTFALDLLLMALVCVCTVAGLQAVGVVLIVALLIIPAVAARFWTNRLGVMLWLSAIFGGLSGLLGTVLSATVPTPEGSLSRGWPTGPLIVLVAAGIFVGSLLAAPRRGLLADVLRRAALRRRVAVQNLLRDAFEALEPGHDLSVAWNPASVARGGVCSASTLRRAHRKGLIERVGQLWRLTGDGQAAAARVVRSHRLWELYLIEQADIAADHVDRDADLIEHILPAELLAQLEARLAQEGRLPERQLAVVPSPHPIPPPASVTSGERPGRRGARGFLLLAIIGACALPQPARADSVGSDADRTTIARAIATHSDERSGSSIAEPPIPASSDTGTHAQASQNARDAGVFFRVGTYEVRADDFWTAGTAVVCSVACGVLGCFLVLRRMSLLGDAISHAILPGLALAFIITQSRAPGPMIAGAMVVGVLTALLSGALNRWGKVPEDASMGVVFTTLFAIGVLLITLAARNVDLDPGCVLYGSIELVSLEVIRLGPIEMPRAFAWLGAVLLLNVTLLIIFYKELKIVCFDPALATTLGISATAVHYGLMTAVATTSVAAFESVGSILVIAMLVAPGATAHLLTDRLSRMLLIAAGVASASAIIGYIGAVALDTSVAGMIASTSLALFMLAVLVAPRQGVLARVMRWRRLEPMVETPPTND